MTGWLMFAQGMVGGIVLGFGIGVWRTDRIWGKWLEARRTQP